MPKNDHITASLSLKFIKVISADKTFWAITIFLCIEALWIALSGQYPMAFDEDFHLGIIKIYAHHLSPFLAHQPPGADVYGAVARDPSYLYQYLMSFPYRLISLISNDLNIQVIFLRLINIALFVYGFILFKRLLLKTGASKTLVHLTGIVFVLLPVVPLLAAQINYDNMVMPLTAGILILAIRFGDDLKNDKFNVSLLILLLCLSLLGSLVKYAFLPIAFVVVAYMLIQIELTFGLKDSLRSHIIEGWKAIRVQLRIGLATLLLLSIGLFAQRYVVNLVDYHNPVPDCSKVLSVKQCSAYGPWIRDYNYKINKVDSNAKTEKYIGQFSVDWLYGMWLRLFFSVDGPATSYQSRGPLPVPSISAVVFAVVGFLALAFKAKTILKKYNYSHLIFLATVSVLYVIALWLDEFRSFLQTDQPVAINGRYLLPILLPVILLLGMAVNEVLKSRLRLKALVAGVSIICLLWGGGTFTYILRSNDAWYFNSQPVYDANHALQHVLAPITPGYGNPAEFLY